MRKMNIKQIKILPVFGLLLFFNSNIQSQSVISPNYGLKSPATLEVVKVDFNADATIIWFTLMSDINNAYFCIDRETYLRKPDGEKIRMKSISGLPNCPSTYRFKRPGEKKAFSMEFPSTGVLPWFSVVEECGGGCLAVYGIITDNELNNSLSTAYSLSDKSESMAAYRVFEEIFHNIDSLNLGIEGAVISNLIYLDRKMGRSETARSWYDKLMTSDAPDLGQYLNNLKQQGISY